MTWQKINTFLDSPLPLRKMIELDRLKAHSLLSYPGAIIQIQDPSHRNEHVLPWWPRSKGILTCTGNPNLWSQTIPGPTHNSIILSQIRRNLRLLIVKLVFHTSLLGIFARYFLFGRYICGGRQPWNRALPSSRCKECKNANLTDGTVLR